MSSPGKVKLPREQDIWIDIGDGLRSYTQRMNVPGGWLYRIVVHGSVAMCFVPFDTPGNSPPPGNTGIVSPVAETV